jgi:hypothetical protein
MPNTNKVYLIHADYADNPILLINHSNLRECTAYTERQLTEIDNMNSGELIQIKEHSPIGDMTDTVIRLC